MVEIISAIRKSKVIKSQRRPSCLFMPYKASKKSMIVKVSDSSLDEFYIEKNCSLSYYIARKLDIFKHSGNVPVF